VLEDTITRRLQPYVVCLCSAAGAHNSLPLDRVLYIINDDGAVLRLFDLNQ
jgi:hypothetical protein